MVANAGTAKVVVDLPHIEVKKKSAVPDFAKSGSQRAKIITAMVNGQAVAGYEANHRTKWL